VAYFRLTVGKVEDRNKKCRNCTYTDSSRTHRHQDVQDTKLFRNIGNRFQNDVASYSKIEIPSKLFWSMSHVDCSLIWTVPSSRYSKKNQHLIFVDCRKDGQEACTKRLYKFTNQQCVTSQKIVICKDEFLKVKVKFTLEQATKPQRGSRGIALLFL